MPDSDVNHTGRVVAAFGRRGVLARPSGEHLDYLVRGRKQHVVCGDHVNWSFDDHGKLAVITDIHDRHNVLERQPVGRAGTEILAANLSLLVVVCAPTPAPDWFLLDRYLCTGALMGCELLLVSNKADLPQTDRRHDAMLAVYADIGYPCLSVSAQHGTGIDTLRAALRDQTGILVGQSGVGKSSLINHLVPAANITIGAVSAATQEGTHTTTASAMHDLPGGGRLIDTPGVRDFIPMIPDSRDVQAGFPEIRSIADDCRFADCRHLREPNCAVKAALNAGTIDARRYESYKRLLHTVGK